MCRESCVNIRYRMAVRKAVYADLSAGRFAKGYVKRLVALFTSRYEVRAGDISL
jgi:hypothetical protein